MFARTERLLLRPGWAEDAPALARAIGDEAIVRNLARAPWPYTEDHAAKFLADTQNAALPSLLVFARTQGAPRLVGGCALQPGGDGAVELGYWIARAHWGLGYATEAARALIEMAEAMGITTLASGHFLDNPASGRVLRKLGFRETGHISARYSLARGAVALHADYVREKAMASVREPAMLAA